MAINLRSTKGSALTHIEMDTNLTSYYVSSSLSGSILNFFTHGTGSFSATTHSIDLQTFLDDTDTTYTAGQGLTLTGTEFSFTGSLFSGNYNDLTNQPTLFDGDYNSLTNQPTIPTVPSNVSAFTNDVGYITSSVGTLYTAGEGLTLTGTEFSLTDPHFSGDYNDLINTPDVSLTLSDHDLTLTKLDGTTDIIDLLPYLDEDARAIASGVLEPSTGIVTFTRDDASTFTLDLGPLLDDTNLVTSVNSKAGVVELTTDDVPEGTVNFYDKEVSFVGQNITINGTYPNFQLTGSNGAVTSVNGQTGDVTLTLFDGDYNSLSNLPILFDGDYNSLTNQPVLFDGSYNSLSDLPTLFDGDYNSLSNLPTLFDGDYNSLSNLPTIPTDNSELTNGAGYITGYTETDTLATVTGRGSSTTTSITAANFITTSDERLKSDIRPIASGLNTLKRFLSYEYVKDGLQDAGFIAQEVKQAIPYSVFEGKNGYLTMNDRPILAHMHKAILELEQRLAAIESKLD